MNTTSQDPLKAFTLFTPLASLTAASVCDCAAEFPGVWLVCCVFNYCSSGELPCIWHRSCKSSSSLPYNSLCMYLAMAWLLSGSCIAYISESASFALRPVPAISSITAFTCCFVERKANRGLAASERANSITWFIKFFSSTTRLIKPMPLASCAPNGRHVKTSSLVRAGPISRTCSKCHNISLWEG